MSGTLYLNAARKLQWTTSNSDNNSTGCSWYGLGIYTNTDDKNPWLNLSNYWGINITTRDNQHLRHNGAIILDSSNYTSYTVTKTGSGASGTWGINITGNAAKVNNVIPEWDGSIAWNDTSWIAAWSNDGTKIKALNKNSFTPSSHKQAYTAAECTSYTTDENTLGVTPAAAKKAAITFALPLTGGTLSGLCKATAFWANQSSGENQVGVSYKGGNLYFWGNNSSGTAGIYDSLAGSVIQRNTSNNKYTFYGNATSIRDSGNGETITLNYSASGLSSTNWLAAWNGYELRAIKPTNITAGSANAINAVRTNEICIGNFDYGTVWINYSNPNASTACTTYYFGDGKGNYSTVSLQAGKVYGAVWNDYAEFRKTVPNARSGQCIVEQGDGTLLLSWDRLLPGCEIISDTFGFAIGETDECKTPIAATGRVLVYPYEDRNSYQPGDAVCSAPGGCVSRMTREEIITYPERIIGTVSEIPTYEVWGADKVKVDGRIWIRIR